MTIKMGSILKQFAVVILCAVPGTLSIYIQMALLLSLIPMNHTFNKTLVGGVEIFLLSNGVHLDLVLPLKNDLKDWNEQLKPDSGIRPGIVYASIGWGDREFYLNTPEWSDLTFSTAFNALFMQKPSALHVSYYRTMVEDRNCIKIGISEDQYCKLVKYIETSFKTDITGGTILLDFGNYEMYDQFYDSHGSYSLFFTCNTWTNRALRESGLKACLWTPFDKGILWKYK